MAISNSIENFRITINEAFVKKANQLRRELIKTDVEPKTLIDVYMGEDDWECKKAGEVSQINEMVLKKGDKLCIDFGTHMVGYVSFDIMSSGAFADAPSFLRLKFGESLCEIGEDSADYNGQLSSSWIQEEYIHIDVLPSRVILPRRYAFRFMELFVKDTSSAYSIKIDKVSLKTMQGCMQDVFEDGPKRDRRLWIGDLRLQALTNYATFKNYELAKRCIYLFAGLTQKEGRVGACLYIEPKPAVGEVALFDYSLFFISCIHDYYNATKDTDFLSEMYPTALRQAEIASERIDKNGVVYDSDDWWCFLDWHAELNKQAGAQAVFIYALKQLKYITTELDKPTAWIDSLLEKLSDGAKKHLWDEEKGFFVSGSNKQISWVSQVWFVLAKVFDEEQNKKILYNLEKENPEIRMVTPYAYHHYVDALIQCGMMDKAKEKIYSYWGEMVSDGADCFYELYDPKDKKMSPYGSRVINSYCHAWSGTPSYFIRKYFL